MLKINKKCYKKYNMKTRKFEKSLGEIFVSTTATKIKDLKKNMIILLKN